MRGAVSLGLTSNQLRDRLEPISRVPQKGGPAPQIDDEPHPDRKSFLSTAQQRGGTPMSDAYEPPFTFTGKIKKVTVQAKSP